MKTAVVDLKEIEHAWAGMRAAMRPPLEPIRGEAQYDAMIAVMNRLLDAVGDDEAHPLSSLLGVVARLVEDYEEEHQRIPDAPPRAVLKFLMEQHGLAQADLAPALGGQSVVSEILSGKREMNLRQARSLARRFGVSPAVFV